jgi:hypothetical protein
MRPTLTQLPRAAALFTLATLLAAPAASTLAQASLHHTAGSNQQTAAPPNIAASIEGLADQPATHTGFVFDRSMLQAARDMLQSEGMSPQRAAVALSTITYDHYGYRQPVTYAPESMAAIVDAYRTAGWHHLVGAHPKDVAATGAENHPRQLTDMWLHNSGADIDGIVVMTRGQRNVNLIQVECRISPLELAHLGGHFGIPKVDPNTVMVPDPQDPSVR